MGACRVAAFALMALTGAPAARLCAQDAPDPARFPCALTSPSYDVYGPSAEDVAHAIPQIEHAAETLGHLFGTAPPRIYVLLFVSPQELEASEVEALTARQVPIVPWYTQSYWEAQPPDRSLGGVDPLSHEAGHMFFNVFVTSLLPRHFAKVRAPKLTTYGHGAAPDWLDEAMATMCEEERLQEPRRQVLRDKLAQRIPLRELFVMDHPWTKEQQDAIRQARLRTAGPVLLEAPDQVTSERQGLFYAECLLVTEFFLEKEGVSFFHEIVVGQLEGRTMEEILTKAKTLPRHLEQLEEAWIEWLDGR